MSKSYSLKEVMYLDHLLQQLATYEVFHGRIVIPKSPEESFELHKKMAEKFNYFKGLIQRGECTVEFIKQSVLGKNGPFPQTKFNPNGLLEGDVKEAPAEVEDGVKIEKNLIDKLLRSFNPLLTEEEASIILNNPVKPTKTPRKPRKKK